MLAKQHYRKFTKLFPDIAALCLTSKNKKRKQLQKDIQTNKVLIVFGTHLLSTTIFHQLSLIIIDKTHKFGIDIKKTSPNKK
ncbi:DEAD/DEAH box helicase [Candidatus Phytoplasma phoenicium]|uniref:DEAD/DEAH box helicase n=1 Tax=Candidatus Phytoplasma phoenicium TaxID=198422 RepID=UPI0034E038D8